MKGRSVAVAVGAVVGVCCLLVWGCTQNGNRGRIQVNSTPTGAEIWLDSVSTGKTTNYLLTSVSPGEHTIKLTLAGHRDWTSGLTVVAGQPNTVDAELLRAYGSLEVSSTPGGAQVWLDSVNTGWTTYCLLESLPTGPHVLQLKKTGYSDWDTTIAVVLDSTVAVAGSLGKLQGMLRVHSVPTGAQVWLDNSSTGDRTDCLVDSVSPGSREVGLKLSGYRRWDTTLTVTVNDTVSIGVTLAPANAELTYIGVNAQGYEEYRLAQDSSVLIKIPAGTFTMGSTTNPDEQPIHDVYMDEFYVDKYEVSNHEYRRFCDATGRAYPDDPHFSGMGDYFLSFPDYPVVLVSWLDAAAYAKWAHKSVATEAQWEKAGRGTDARTYPWGNAEPDSTLCNMDDGDTFSHTSPVGQFAAGASFYGCADLAGNVWEWCSDWYGSDYYSFSPDSNPTGPTTGSDRVAKGGSYNNGQSVWVRCAERYWGPESGGNHPALGFRCTVP